MEQVQQNTEKMTLEEKKNLSREEIEKLAQQKLQNLLKETLLKIGGEDVEFLENTFSMQINIYKKGKLINPLQQSILFGEDDFECEIQSLKIYKENKEETEFDDLKFLSGFALHKQDQTWRLHSWLQYKSPNLEEDPHLKQNEFAKQQEKILKKEFEQEQKKEEQQQEEQEEEEKQDQQEQQQQTDNEKEKQCFLNDDELDQVEQNAQKYEKLIQDNQKEYVRDSDIITVETTIDEIELYYGYIADKKEIEMRTKSVEQYFDQPLEEEGNEEGNLDDDLMGDEDDMDDEQWEDEGDENWEDDEEEEEQK